MFRRVQFFHVNGRRALSHRQVNGFARVLIERLQVRQAQPANIQLPQRRLPIEKQAIPRWYFPLTLQSRKPASSRFTRNLCTVLTGNPDSFVTSVAERPPGA